MSSFQYAGQDEVAYNPASENLNMNLNLITNAAGIQSFALDADEVNVGANLRFNDISYAVVISAVGLDEDQTYNLPAIGGTSGQVLGLTGNSGQLIWYTVSGGAVAGVTSLNSFTDAVTIQSNNLSITNDLSNNSITIDSVAGPTVSSLNTCTGAVELVSMTLSITPDISNGQIALDVAIPYVSALDGLSGEVLLTATDASIVKTLSGQEIDLRVAVPVVAGTADGDYPTWDSVRGNYGVGVAPVASLNGLNGILGISGGAGIAVDTTSPYITISTLPCGIAIPGISDEGIAFFTISGVSANLSATSVVLAVVQYVDDIVHVDKARLDYTTPAATDGGSITFNLSDPISISSTLRIAWMVAKF